MNVAKTEEFHMENETSILNALERIAAALETAVQHGWGVSEPPAWVKAAESVLNDAKEVHDLPSEKEKAPEPSKKTETTPVAETTSNNGKKIAITAGDHAGKSGVLLGKSGPAWLNVKLDNGDEVKVRKSMIEEVEEVQEVVEKPVEPVKVEAAPMPAQPDSPGAFIVKAGKHKDKTIRSVYNEGQSGARFIEWAAESHSDADFKGAAVAFLNEVHTTESA